MTFAVLAVASFVVVLVAGCAAFDRWGTPYMVRLRIRRQIRRAVRFEAVEALARDAARNRILAEAEHTMNEEWFEMRDHKSGKVVGHIPRSVVESLGVDCSPADRRPQGTIFFAKEQSRAIHKHPRWEPAPDLTDSPVPS